MKRWVCYGVAAMLTLVLAAGNGIAAAKSPIQAVKDLDKQLESYKVGPHLTAEERAYNRQLKQEVMVGTFDIHQLSKESLGRHWEVLSSYQRNEFVELMTQLLQKKAIFSKEQAQTHNKSYSISYQKEVYLDPEKQRSEVFTVIDVPSEDVRLNISYKLKWVNGEWKIYDVIVDDASLAKNYAYQFNAIITKNGYPELLRRMQSKLSDLEAEQKEKGGSDKEEPLPEPVPPPEPAAPAPAKENHGFFSCSLSL